MKRMLTFVAVLVLVASAASAQSMKFKNTAKGEAINAFASAHNLDVVFDTKVEGKFTGPLAGKSWENDLKELLGPSYRAYRGVDGKVHITKYESFRQLSVGLQRSLDPSAAPESVAALAPDASGLPVEDLSSNTEEPVRIRTATRPASVTAAVRPAAAMTREEFWGYSVPAYQPPPAINGWGSGWNTGAYNSGYGYIDPIDYSRQTRKLAVENQFGAFRVENSVGRRISRMKVYVDGCYRDIASEIDNWTNGKASLAQGKHRIDIVEMGTGIGYGEDVYVEPKAVTETFKTQHFNILVDEAGLVENYPTPHCSAPAAQQ